ncbi:hypothetical protein [Cohnella boryungensis]|uniref:Uncharacterized protein n=1 Tax=Cohnella boryungensis TaxID=768479 RepID=A0ABV8SAW0_9BACL
MSLRRKVLSTILLLSFVIIGTYLILNQLIVLDRTSQTLGEYDYGLTSADVEVLVEGTGKQNITGNTVSTNVKIKALRWNNTSNNLAEGREIEVNEYFVVYKNRKVLSTLFVPGRSIYGMGTSYKRPKKGEQRIIHLKFNIETKQYWIMPEELVKK